MPIVADVSNKEGIVGGSFVFLCHGGVWEGTSRGLGSEGEVKGAKGGLGGG